MTDLTKLTISQATTGLKNKDFSAVELTTSYINQMEKTDNLNAYIKKQPIMHYLRQKLPMIISLVVICDLWKVYQLHTKIYYVQKV